MSTSIVKWVEGSMGESPVLHLDASQLMLVVSPLDPLMITSFALSMAVNALVTTLIVFKILKVFLEVKPALGSVATEGTKLRSVIFIIIESGMALFAIQLVRVVLSCLELNESTVLAFGSTIGINQMFNVIIILFFIFCFTNNVYLAAWLGHRTNINFGADFNEIVR